MAEMKSPNAHAKKDRNDTPRKRKTHIIKVRVTAEEKLHILEDAEKQVQEQFARGEVSKEQYRALQREIEKTKNDLGKYETELEEAKKASSQLDQTADELGKEMDDLGEEVKAAIDNSYNVLRTRIDRFGVAQPNIQALEGTD